MRGVFAVGRLTPWVLPLLLLTFWQLSSSLGWSSGQLIPAPKEVALALIGLIRSGDLAEHLAISAGRAFGGFAIGGASGFLLGLCNGWSLPAERLLDTSLQMLRNIPHLALVPLFIIWFGIGEETKVSLVILGVFFPVYINTMLGLKNVDPKLIEMGRCYGLSGYSLFRDILFPGAVPSILAGVRYSLGMMWMTLIVAETIASNSGIGYLAMNAREFMQTDVLVLSILIYATLGKLADWVARRLENYLLSWHPGYNSCRTTRP